jgi:flagellin
MEIRHNQQSNNSSRIIKQDKTTRSSIEKLSSGIKINNNADNDAKLAVAEKMRAQSAGLSQAVKDDEEGLHKVQAAEGALLEIQSILNRMKTLASQYANGTFVTDEEKTKIGREFTQQLSDIDKAADTNSDLTAAALGLNTENLILSSPETANKAIDVIDTAIMKASRISKKLGEIQTRFEHSINNRNTANEHLQKVESQIRDTDALNFRLPSSRL